MDRSLSCPRVLGAGGGLQHAPLGTEHCVSRTRPAGCDGRSGLAQRALLRTGHPSASRPRRRADGRAYHLSLGRSAASQVRPADAGPRSADVLVRRGFPGRKLSALPRLFLCRALRRQQLSLSDAGDGLFRHRRRPKWGAGAGVSRHPDAVLRGVVHQRLAVSDLGVARAGACAQCLQRAGVFRGDRDRSRPRCVSAGCARVFRDLPRVPAIRGRGARPDQRRAADVTLQQQVLPLTGVGSRDTGQYRGDHLLVAEMVDRGSKVLDVGCGDGDLLELLEARGIDGRGIELSREGVNRCVAKGLAVVQGDADTDLINYPDDAFDYVILSQTLQATRQPRVVLENLLRIGRRAIVSFPNFGFWKMRLQLLVGGHMPRTENLPATWYDTPNTHFCTIKDFVQLCDEINVKMERAVALDLYGRPLRLNAPWWFWNMFGEQGVFLLSRAGQSR